ncbi:PREDICTED: polycomb group protein FERTILIZATION-INDEPENDENT SEED 2-like [Brassica oleracea var. oleracea]|nr:PREDICTED: polycomb group protein FERTILIZATION-INDEPENDENT SEED 2-like [Brassica oleracea var. oleracea]
MAGVKPLTEEDKEVISLYGKPITLYGILQAFTQDKPRFLPRCLSYKIQARKNKMANLSGITIFNYMNCNNIILRSQVVKRTSCPFCRMKCGSLKGVKHHLTSSHALFDFNFRLSENGHPMFDVSVKPDAFKNGVVNYDLEEHDRVNIYFYRSRSCMRGQRAGPKGRKCCKIFEMYSEDVPRDKANEIPHVNGDNITSSLARTRLSGQTSEIQTITQPEIGQSSRAKGPRAIGRKRLNPRRLEAERTDLLRSRQFYHSKTLQPMTLEEVLSDADSDNENDKEFKDFQERMKIDRLVDASDDEKRFMGLWNTFMGEQSVYVDKHVPWACEQFVKHHAKELITPKLSWQWRMFAIDTLCIKYGLISPKTMDKCSIILQKAQLEEEFPEEAAAAAEVEALEEAEAAVAAAAEAAAKAEKAAKAAAVAAAAKASAAKGTRKSARIQKKKMQEAERRTLAMVCVRDLHF